MNVLNGPYPPPAPLRPVRYPPQLPLVRENYVELTRTRRPPLSAEAERARRRARFWHRAWLVAAYTASITGILAVGGALGWFARGGW